MRAGAVALRDGLTGRLVTRLEVGRLRPGQGYHFLHRADLIAILREGAVAAGVDLRLSCRVAAVELGGRPSLTLADGTVHPAELLVGADGLHSLLRGALNGEVAPFFTGQVAWRALIPGDAGPPEAEVHMGTGRHLVSYPLREGGLRNIVAVEERRGWAEESWSLRDDPRDLRAAFGGFSGRVRGWLDQVEEVWLWGLFRHPVAKVWQKALPDGAVAIVGDAAHPTLPFLAQGASMALEDAWVLAECLASHEGWSGLAAYQAARAERCARIVEAASRNARVYHLGGVARMAAHAGLRLGGWLAPDLALRRFDWLYGYDVTSGAAGSTGPR
jgi:salicylate hydroxylase